jgi:hypothetical protein
MAKETFSFEDAQKETFSFEEAAGIQPKSTRAFSLPPPIDPLGLSAGPKVISTGSVLDGVSMVDPQANAQALANAVKNNPALVNSPMYRTGLNVLSPQGETAVQGALRRNAQDVAGQQRKQKTVQAARDSTDAAFGDSAIAQALAAPFRRLASGAASTVGAVAGVPQLFGSELGQETSEALNLMAQANMPADPGLADQVAAGIGQVGPMAMGGQMLRTGLARLVGEKSAVGAAGTAMGAVGGTLSGNQVLSDLEFRSDLSQEEKLARAQAATAISAALGRVTDRFLLPGAKGGTGGAIRPIAGAFTTQGGEEIVDQVAQNYLTDKPITEGAGSAGLVGGLTGAMVRGAGVLAERQTPESIIAQAIEEAAAQPAPAYRVADPMTDAANVYRVPTSPTAPTQQAAPAIPQLPYDPSIENIQTLIADQQGNVRPEDSAEAFYREQARQAAAEMGLTDDVIRAQQAREQSAAQPAPQAEPELLQMLRRAGWKPQQEVFNQKPDLAPEQVQQLEAALSQNVEAEYQQAVKDEIKQRLGMTRQSEAAAPESYAQNPLLRLIAGNGGINLDERSDFDVDPKRQTKTGQIMPNPYNIGGNPLFRKGGRQGDMLVELLQQNGYLTQEQIDQADANTPGGSYQLAYDMVSKAIQDPTSIGIDPQDAPTRRAQTAQAKQLEADASRFGIDTRGMDERQIANQINRVQRRAEQPQTPDFQSRKLSRIEDAETARGRAMAEKLDRLERFAEFRDLDEVEVAALAEVLYDDNGQPVVTTRAEIDRNTAYAEYLSTLGQENAAENTAERPLARQNQAHSPREPAQGIGGAGQNPARAQQGSDAGNTGTGQDADQTLTVNQPSTNRQPTVNQLTERSALTSYTEAEVRQREERAASEARKQERERIEAERRIEADAQRDDFTLTGSDRAADQGAARGQNALFTVSQQKSGFFSALAAHVVNLNANAMPAQGWKDAVTGAIKAGKVKADEVEWTGLNEWLDLQQGKVTKEQVTQYLDANGVRVEEVKLGANPEKPWAYQDGATGEYEFFATEQEAEEKLQNEIAYQQESADAIGETFDFDIDAVGTVLHYSEIDPDKQNNPTKYESYTLPGGTNYREVLLTLPSRSAQYKSSHWDQPNVLAHIRLNDRVDADGKRVLFVEEIQSDWGQDGKKKGFAPSAKEQAEIDAITREVDAAGGFDKAPKELQDRARAAGARLTDGGTPTAPFVTSTDKWLTLALKRIVTMAAQEGYDRVAFVNGEQSADRYRLRNQIDRVAITKTGGVWAVNAWKDGQKAITRDAPTDSELANLVGKELAERAIKDGGGEYAGLDLEVGGEGMKAFYDKIVPNTMNALLKKFGGNSVSKWGASILPDNFQLTITPELRKIAQGGLPLFSQNSSKTLANFRNLTGDYNASTAKADAEQMLGFDSPVPILPKADYALAQKNVPMWYDLDTKTIYYNTAFKNHDRARDAQWMTEEILHAMDHVGDNRLLSKGSGMFSEGAEIRQELESAYQRSQIVKSMLQYPLDYKQEFTDDRIAAELFARAGVLFKGFPDALKAAAPKTYEVYRDIFNSIASLRGEIRQSSSERAQEPSGQRIDGRGNATAGEGGARGRADSRLASIRGIIAERLGSSGEGRRATLGSAKLEARAPWDVPDPTRLDAIRRDWQDNRIDIKKTVDSIKKYGASIGDDANPYLRDELYIGRVRDQLDKFADSQVTPLLRAISNSGISLETINRYLWARHAKERNQQMAKVNQETFTDDLNYAGMSTREARAELAKLASTKDYIKLQKIAAMVDDITRDTRTKIVTDGLEDAAVIKAWEGAYKFYVPLQRDIEESGKRGAGFNVKGSESRRAVGSEKEATNILANVIAQAESAIVRSEKAVVGRSVLELAKQNPNSDFWTVDTPPTEKVIDPRTGVVTNRVIPNYKNMDNVFVVKEAGVERFVTFNERNERAMEFARALKNLDAADVGAITETVGKGTRYLAQWVTARNPFFWATNFARDLQGVAFNLQSTPLKGQSVRVMARIPQALAGVTKSKLGKGGKYAKLAEEFKAAGGQTGFMQSYENSLERMTEIQKEVDRLGRKAYDPRKWGMALLDVIDGANDVIENGVRLAVFAQAREQGIGIDQAASIAKNISVNFNRKGNKTAVMNSWYMFANASIQGNARLIEGIATSKRSQVAAGLLVAAGAAMAYLNWAISGDDEESRKRRYELVPQHERERNWILFFPNSDEYVKIPLPLGPHVLFNAGRIGVELGTEKDADPLEKAASFVSSFFGAFNPIGGGLPSADIKGLAQIATPTVFRPLTDVAVNQNFAGTPIAKQDFPGQKGKPDYTKAKDSTAPYWTAASKAMNDATGGDNIKPGSVNIKPETLAYILKSYVTPGIAQTADKVASQAVSKKEVDWVDRPGVSKFFGRIDEGNRARAAYETREKDKARAQQYEAYLNAGERAKAQALIKEWGGGNADKGFKLYAQYENLVKQEQAIARERRAIKKMPEAQQEARMNSLDERRARVQAVYLRNRRDITGEEE